MDDSIKANEKHHDRIGDLQLSGDNGTSFPPLKKATFSSAVVVLAFFSQRRSAI
jgi:hypothetical protein